MKIYFACAIVGGRQDEAIYQHLVRALLADGHEVPTAINASPSWQQLEGLADAREVYRRDTSWIDECQALIAEVSTPSHGVGYEISYALDRGMPALCIYRRGVRVSKMLAGNTMPGMTVADYGDIDEGIKIMRGFLDKIDQSRKPLATF